MSVGTWREVPGVLHSWDLSTGVDGPGTRFVAFLAGCPLRCLYCQNPDTWHIRDGDATVAGQVIDRAARYRPFTTRGGGLTLSGGEPLRQPEFAEALLTGAQEAGLHTALDTSGFLGARASDNLIGHTDLVLLDIKSWNPVTYKRVTGVELEPTLAFAERLAGLGVPMWIRFVLVPGLTDDPQNVAGLARFVAGLSTVERVDVLPFHRMGAAKYERLGIPFPLAEVTAPGPDLLARVRGQFADAGLTVV